VDRRKKVIEARTLERAPGKHTCSLRMATEHSISVYDMRAMLHFDS
jgi:hypothetical protein